jgi:hypothetical protein
VISSLVGALLLAPVPVFAQQVGPIRLEWLAASGAVAGYDVYVELNGEATVFHDSVTEPRAEITSPSFRNGDALRFRVAAFATDGHRGLPSAYSDVIIFGTLSAPTNVIVTNGNLVNPIAVVWNVVTHASEYAVYRSTAPGTRGSIVGRVPFPYFQDLTALADVNYYYSVVASRGEYESGFSAQVQGLFGDRRPELVATPASLSYSFGPSEYIASQTFELRNVGDWQLQYSVWVGGRWLSASTTAGALDGEVDTLTLTYSTGKLPPGEHRTLLWIYSYFQPPAGEEWVLGDPLEIEVVVNIPARDLVPVNRAPLSDPLPPTTISAGETAVIPVTAFDHDVGDRLAFIASSLPPFATLRDYGNGTAEFTFSPTAAHVGSYLIVAAVVDSGSPPATFILAFEIIVAP